MKKITNPLDLSGKVFLLTGASSGIGRHTADVLSRLGARLVLSGRRQEALAAIRAEMERPDEHLVAPFDLSTLDAIPDWVKEQVSALGRPLSGLVHAAGSAEFTPLRAVTQKRVDDLAAPALNATIGLLRAVATKGVISDEGSVVLVSSLAGVVGSPGLVAYSALKGAIQATARSAAAELAGRRIRVNSVVPGYVATPMSKRLWESLPGGEAKIMERQFLGIIPPSEVAVAIAFLLSDASRFVTGTSLIIDGGYSCS